MATVEKQGRPNDQKQDQWQQDLNPDPVAGQNHGPQADEPGRFERTAYDIKELHERMTGFSSDDLRQIPVLHPNARLEQGSVYINLNDSERKEFTGMGNMTVREQDYIVPKDHVAYPLWNHLIGVENPERLDQAR
jgi:hypothetical protein